MRVEKGDSVMFKDALGHLKIGTVTTEKYDEIHDVYYYSMSIGTEKKQGYYGVTQNQIMEVLK